MVVASLFLSLDRAAQQHVDAHGATCRHILSAAWSVETITAVTLIQALRESSHATVAMFVFIGASLNRGQRTKNHLTDSLFRKYQG
jgi:hypothetical protein